MLQTKKTDCDSNDDQQQKLFPPFRKMRFSQLLLVTTIFLVLFLLNACGGNTANENAPVISGPPNTAFPMPPLNNKPLGSMGWALADGKRNQFSEYSGKVLVLDFYATWCAPCRESVPHLIELQKRFGDKGLQVVGLNVGGPDDLDKVPAFAHEFRIQYPLGVPDDELSRFLLTDNTDIPQTFVFDRQGQLKRRFVGFREATADQMDEAVEAALKSAAE